MIVLRRKTINIMSLIAIICCLLIAPISASINSSSSVLEVATNDIVSRTDEYVMKGFEWISDKLLGTIESLIPESRTARYSSIEGRKKKKKKVKMNKYVFPMIVGFLMIKAVILPLTLKALALLSGKAIVLSFMSLILAAIVGLRSLGGFSAFSLPAQAKVDLVNVPLKYRRKDMMVDHMDQIEEDPYRYYSERRRRRK